MKVLIVDNNTIAREVVSSKMKKRGYEVILASSKEEAVEAVRRNPGIDAVMASTQMGDLTDLVMRGIEETTNPPERWLFGGIINSQIQNIPREFEKAVG